VENVPEILSGTLSKERAYPLVLSGSFVAKDPKTRSLEGFCGENPNRKTSNSIQLRLTIHPSHTGVKGDRTENRGRLNTDFREARNFTLLRAERVGKWGLSGVLGPVCPVRLSGNGSRQNPRPERQNGSLGRRCRVLQPGGGRSLLGVQPGCNPDATRLQRY
jgi:hypothetical protein